VVAGVSIVDSLLIDVLCLGPDPGLWILLRRIFLWKITGKQNGVFHLDVGHSLLTEVFMGEYPENAAEWWALLERHKEQLLDSIGSFHPWYETKHNYKITATKAEDLCKEIRESIKDKGDPRVLFEQYLLNRNTEMVGLLNEVWFGMPESQSVRMAPGFGVLCDLCSEAWVLNDE